MRTTALLLSVATLAIAAPAAAQEATPTTNAERQTPTQGTAAGAVQSGTPGQGDPAGSQETGAGAGDIIITATRRNSPLSDVPIAVSAVTQEALQNTGANDIRALNQLAPSLLVSSTGNESNASARIRGIGTVGDNPGLESSVATFIDGVYRSRTGVGLNELGEIERVEVLRGPQGTLFGRNASAGLINIVTRAPEFEFGGIAEATYGNYDNIRFQGGITGPLIGDSVAFRVDGVYNERKGFLRNITQSNNEERVNDRDRYFVRGQLLFKPSDNLSLRLIGDYTKRDESCCGATYYSKFETFDATANAAPNASGATVNTDGNVTYNANNRILSILNRLGAVRPTTDVNADPFDRSVAISQGRTFRNETEDYGGSAQLDFSIGDVSLTSITAYREYKSGNAGDTDYGNVDLSYRDTDSFREFKTFTQELRLQGSLFEDKLDWLVGGFYSNEKLRLVDSTKFGTQYGAFAACRIVAGTAPATDNIALQNVANPGCLGTTPIAAFGGATGRQAFGGNPAFAGLGGTIVAALDRLSTVNNVGDQGSVYRQKSENYAFFTHNIFNVTDTLSVTLGLRYTHEAKDLRANFNNNNTACPAQQAALGGILSGAAIPAGTPAATVAALRGAAGSIITLTCTGNSSSSINALDIDDSFDDDEFTGTAVVSWKPTPRLLTYASYSKGYKAGGYNLDRSDLGGPNGVFSPRSNADAAGLQFDAEKVNAYEIGAKYNVGRVFSLNLAAFRQEFQDFQLNSFNGSIFVVQNIQACSNDLGGLDRDNAAAVPGTGSCVGDANRRGVISQGVEVEATMSPIRDITFNAGYTYSDTYFRNNLVGSSSGEALDPALFLLPGQQLSNAPKNVVTASFAWTPDIGSRGLSGLFYVDTRLSSDYNTGSDLAPEKAQDGFALVNARLGLRGPDQRWAIELWAQNVFDKDYIQVAFNTPFQGAGSRGNVQNFGGTGGALYSAFLAEPRTYGLTVRSRF